MLKKIFTVLTLFYLVLLLLVYTIFTWPETQWWLANLISMGPSWVFALPLLLTLPALLFCTKKKGLIFANLMACLLLYEITDLRLNPELDSDKFISPLEIKVLSANMGNSADTYQLLQIIEQQHIDITALQETSSARANALKQNKSFNTVCAGGLCLLSHYSIKLIDSKSRRFLNYWGSFVAHFEIQLPTRLMDFFVVHLQTPREGIQEMIFSPIKGISLMKKITEYQNIESWIASNWVGNGKNSIVAGDFNMSDRTPMYYANWSWLKNSFRQVGNGFGYTKFTHWHGVRIDHILFAKSYWAVRKAWVANSIGGDHHPIIAILEPK